MDGGVYRVAWRGLKAFAPNLCRSYGKASIHASRFSGDVDVGVANCVKGVDGMRMQVWVAVDGGVNGGMRVISPNP